MKNRWIGEARVLYEDCEKVGFNIDWLERKLGECNRIEIYKALIQETRNKPQYKEIFERSQINLHMILTQLIHEYCL